MILDRPNNFGRVPIVLDGYHLFWLGQNHFGKVQITEGSRLMRIWLLRIFKTFHKYLPYANFGLFISLVRFLGQKIAKQIAVMK